MLNSYSFKDPYFFFWNQKDQTITIITDNDRRVHQFEDMNYQDAFLLSSDNILCRSDNKIDFYDQYLSLYCSKTFSGIRKIKPCSFSDSIFYILGNNHISECYLKFDQNTMESTLIKYKLEIPDDNLSDIRDFAVSKKYFIILTKTNILVYLKEDSSQKLKIDLLSHNAKSKLFCDELNFYLYIQNSQIVYMYSFGSSKVIKIFEKVKNVYSSESVIIHLDKKIAINGTLINNENINDHMLFIGIDQGQLFYFQEDENETDNPKPTFYPQILFPNFKFQFDDF